MLLEVRDGVNANVREFKRKLRSLYVGLFSDSPVETMNSEVTKVLVEISALRERTSGHHWIVTASEALSSAEKKVRLLLLA